MMIGRTSPAGNPPNGVAVVPPNVRGMLFTPRSMLSMPTASFGPPNGRRYSQTRRKALILANTRRMLAEHGCASVKIRSLAKLSGVTPPTIYHLIGARSEVLELALREALRAKLSKAKELAASEDIHVPIAYAMLTWAAIAHDPAYYRQAIRLSVELGLDRKLESEINAEISMAIGKWLMEMRACGQLRTDNIPLGAIGDVIARQSSATTIAWMHGEISIEKLGEDLITGATLALLGVVSGPEAERIEQWFQRFMTAVR